MLIFFFFQAEDGIRDAQESRGLGDVYKRQVGALLARAEQPEHMLHAGIGIEPEQRSAVALLQVCLLYTSDAADDLPCVDPGGRRIIKKNTQINYTYDVRRYST